MLVETAKPYFTYATRVNRASSDASRRLIIEHEVLPAAYEEPDQKVKEMMFRLANRSQAA